MKKIAFCFPFFLVQGALAQIVLTSFSPDIPHSEFTSSLDAFGNDIVTSSSYVHDLSQRRVFVFEKNGTMISQNTYFTPTDALPFDNFGEKVSINNDFIAASSRLNDQVALNAGAVYMYRKVNGNWIFFQKITAFDGVAEDNFGTDVKVLGNQLFISAINNEPIGQPSSTDSGAVYVYNFNGTTWFFSQKITLNGTNKFGKSIKVSNNKMVVEGSGLNTFLYDGNNWNYLSTITSTNVVDFDLDNDQLFVLKMEGSNSNMEIYNNESSNWSLTNTLTGLQNNDKIATNFKVKDDKMFISLNFHSLLYSGRTPVSVYKKINNEWTFQEYIQGNGPNDQDDAFGTKIAITNNLVAIGAPLERMPLSYGGNAYTFDVALGLNENALTNLRIFPNPTYGEINIENDSLDLINSVNIYQYDGKLVKSIETNFETISLNELQNGVYFLKITTRNGKFVSKKIIKI